jgi:hypothetical protein
MRKLGISGVRAQGRAGQAPASLGNGFFRTELRWHSFGMKHNRHDDGQQHQKNETVPEGCESTIMLISHCEKATLNPIATVSDTNDLSVWRANLATRNTSVGLNNVGRTKSYWIADEVAVTTKLLCGDGQLWQWECFRCLRLPGGAKE